MLHGGKFEWGKGPRKGGQAYKKQIKHCLLKERWDKNIDKCWGGNIWYQRSTYQVISILQENMKLVYWWRITLVKVSLWAVNSKTEWLRAWALVSSGILILQLIVYVTLGVTLCTSLLKNSSTVNFKYYISFRCTKEWLAIF